MNKLLVISVLIFSFSINAQTFINPDLEGKIDLESNTLSVKIKEIIFSGSLTSIRFKYKNYYLIKGEGQQLLISFENIRSKRETKISEIIICNEDYDKLVKNITKNKFNESKIFFKYNYMFDASKNKELNTIWDNIEYLETQNKLKESYDTISDLKNFEGKYYVKILKSGGLDYSKVDYKAEIYLTDAGFTFKSEIPGIMLLRGTHYIKEEFLPKKTGTFIIRIGGSNNTLISLIVSSNKKSGSFSYNEYGKTNTTIFRVENYEN